MADQKASSCRLDNLGDGYYALSGDLGFGSAARLLSETKQEFASHPYVEVDLGAVTDADSAGLALLIEWTREARQSGRRVAFRYMPPRLEAIARISGVAPLLPRAA